jgi:hypothetical protein
MPDDCDWAGRIGPALAPYRIELLSEGPKFCVVTRENCFALIQAGESGALGIGSSGMMTENGLAYLVFREGGFRLAAKGSEVPATSAEVEAIQNFSNDLKAALAAGTMES